MTRMIRIAAAALAVAPLPAAAATTIDLGLNGRYDGQPGYLAMTQSFALPADATDVALTIKRLEFDDRGVVRLNGVIVDSAGIFSNRDGTVGSFNFGQNAPRTTFTFNRQGVRDRVITTGFLLGQNNTFTFEANDTGAGINGNVLATATTAQYVIEASVSYGSAVPEPATWAMMLLGFGGIGATLRSRRRPAVRFA